MTRTGARVEGVEKYIGGTKEKSGSHVEKLHEFTCWQHVMHEHVVTRGPTITLVRVLMSLLNQTPTSLQSLDPLSLSHHYSMLPVNFNLHALFQLPPLTRETHLYLLKMFLKEIYSIMDLQYLIFVHINYNDFKSIY